MEDEKRYCRRGRHAFDDIEIFSAKDGMPEKDHRAFYYYMEESPHVTNESSEERKKA